jgi:hypothetical protein
MDSLELFEQSLYEQLDEKIQPPPASAHDSCQEAQDALIGHARENGYGVAIYLSRPHYSATKSRYYYQCDRSGHTVSKATKNRTGTHRVNCPFRATVYQAALDGRWRLDVTNPKRNHTASLNPAAHHVHRKRSELQKNKIFSMSEAGVPPRQILSALRQDDPDTIITSQDIRNDIQMAKGKELGQRQPIEALLDDLSTDEWVFDVKKDSENRIQCLFFAHKRQIQQLRANPDILMIDCTYKTNRYRLPLLQIIGYSNLGSWFSAGFCFIASETEQDYYWAVATYLSKTRTSAPKVFLSDQEKALKNAVSTLLPSVPQLLCIWHINKNVQTKAQHTWRTADAETAEEKQQFLQIRAEFMRRWSQVVYSETREAFNAAWDRLLSDYSDQRSLCEYLRDYIYPSREQWAIAWTSQHRHYGTVATSAIEGKHKVLKMYLATSQGDLRRTVDVIKEMVLNQCNAYDKDLATARFNIQTRHTGGELFVENIHQYITPPALDYVLEQNKLRQDNIKHNRTKPCTGTFERTRGIPCSHTIQSILDRGSKVSMLAFKDEHWHFQRRSGSSVIVPRPNQLTRNPPLPKPRGKRLHRAVTREPSAFERPVLPTAPTRQSVREEILEEIRRDSHHVNRCGSQCGSSPAATPIPMSVAVSVPVTVAMTTPASAPVSSSFNISVPISVNPTPVASPIGSPQVSPVSVTVSVPISITLTPPPQSPEPPPPYSPLTPTEEVEASPPPTPKPEWHPTLEEFVADIEHQRCQTDMPAIQTGRNVSAGIGALWSHLKKTGQENDRQELVVAREYALATTGPWATATPEVVWSFFFGDRTVWHRWRDQERHCWLGGSAESSGRVQRSAARKASAAWKDLSPRKRQRR